MGHEVYYLSDKVSKFSGLNVWLLKVPFECNMQDSDTLLGSIARKNDMTISPDYPEPRVYRGTDGIAIKALEEHKDQLNITSNIINERKIAGYSFTIDKSTGLKLEGDLSIPALPISIKIGFEASSIHKMKYTLGGGGASLTKNIRRGDLEALSKMHEGEAENIFPKHYAQVYENYIVDRIVMAKEYKIQYYLQRKLNSQIEAEIKTSTNAYGAKLQYEKKDDYSFELSINENSFYLIGLHVLTWTEIWDDPWGSKHWSD